MNQFANFTEMPNAKFDAVVAPNADTLYSSAFVDLEKEPIVFTVPPVEDRYVLFPILDAWTNVLAAPGTRTTGALGGNYLLMGPGWKGTVPPGVIPIACPTNRLWIIGRDPAQEPGRPRRCPGGSGRSQAHPALVLGEAVQASGGADATTRARPAPPTSRCGRWARASTCGWRSS